MHLKWYRKWVNEEHPWLSSKVRNFFFILFPPPTPSQATLNIYIYTSMAADFSPPAIVHFSIIDMFCLICILPPYCQVVMIFYVMFYDWSNVDVKPTMYNFCIRPPDTYERCTGFHEICQIGVSGECYLWWLFTYLCRFNKNGHFKTICCYWLFL